MDSKKILYTIIIPAWREEKGLPVVLSKVYQIIDDTYEVIVVDDGSDDGTSRVASQFPCRVIRHEINKGKGESILTGAKNAVSDNLIYIDADDTYPPDAIPQIAQALQKYDMVLGSRRYGQNNIPLFNRLGNYVLRNMIRNLYGFKPYDPLTGLWGIKKWQLFRCAPTVRFAPDAEICMKAGKLKLKTFDISITYAPRMGKTKLPPIKAGFQHLNLILGLLFWKPETTR